VTSGEYVPVAVTDTNNVLKTIQELSGGLYRSCALNTDGTAACWGRNDFGQNGTGTTITTAPYGNLVPVAVGTSGLPAGFTTIKKIVPGNLTTCVIAADDQVYCLGANSLIPAGFNPGITSAIDSRGALGDGTTTDSLTFTRVALPTGTTVKEIGTGCALTTTNQVYCWGNNSNGRLGVNSPVPASAGEYSATPVLIGGLPAGKNWVKLVSSLGTACVLDDTGAEYCWGNNTAGQAGNNSTTTPVTTPTQVVGPAIKPVAVTLVGPTGSATPATTTGTNVLVPEDSTVTFTSPANPVGLYELSIAYGTGGSGGTAKGQVVYGAVANVGVDGGGTGTPGGSDPSRGTKAPTTAFNCGAGMTCVITWTPALGPTGEFLGGTQYTANVEVTADTAGGYTLNGLGAISINGHLVPLTDNNGTVAHGSYMFLTPTAGGGAGAAAVPTLGEWALLRLALMMTTGAGFALRHRKA
jgi:alpha-tubulin suppressor-like RCC1 family protein